MTALGFGLLVLATFAVAALGIGRLRRYALQRSLIDHPNARSAHDVPTPRGGGLAFVVAFLLSLGLFAASGGMQAEQAIAIGGASAIVAGIGFADDHRHVAARWRLLAHSAAAAWLLAWLGDLPGSEMLAAWGVPAPLAYALAAFLIVWLVNLFNFMDGIDGIASVETVTVALGGALVGLLAGEAALAPLTLLLAASLCGFLLWNWPPARIFMGDVGSGFLGVVLAGLAIGSALADPALLWCWAILLGLFVVDSGLTLLRRAVRGDRLYEAHRMHAYQHAALRLRSHRAVTLATAAINVFWLLPIAVAAALRWLPPPLALAIAYLPLVALALGWGAGRPSEPQAPPTGGSRAS